ncbi:MAG TPA: LacI family DNA-binding transcriptional regulator [Friedmanniella sp.]
MTLADVARLAGVSKGTASKALNEKHHVHPQTRGRVLAAAEQLAFRPNVLARELTSGRSRTVGVLTNDLEGRFVLPVLAGAEDALGAGELSVLLCDARGDSIRERHHLQTLLDRRIEGLIVVGGARTEPRPSLGLDLPVPIVYVYAPSASPEDLSLTADDPMGGRLAAEHLWELGRRKVAYLPGDSTYLATGEREEGARAALRERGAELVVLHSVNADWTERWGRAATARLLQEHPEVDALIAASDGLGRAALDVLRDLGRRVPDEIAVMSFDNWSAVVTHTRPELTSIDLGLEDLGRTAARRLFAAISGGELGAGHQRLPVRLVVRGSTSVH